MVTNIVEAHNTGTFYTRLCEEIQKIEKYRKIIDIKFSTFYDAINRTQVYTALILSKKEGNDNE